jgi:hypothetical protein
MRKILIALAGGIAATTAPAQAKVRVFIGVGAPGYYDPYYDPGYYDPYYEPDYFPDPYYVVHRRHHVHHPVRCKWVRAWHHHHWVTYKKCYRIRY